jgi:hypothetical protein
MSLQPEVFARFVSSSWVYLFAIVLLMVGQAIAHNYTSV